MLVVQGCDVTLDFCFGDREVRCHVKPLIGQKHTHAANQNNCHGDMERGGQAEEGGGAPDQPEVEPEHGQGNPRWDEKQSVICREVVMAVMRLIEQVESPLPLGRRQVKDKPVQIIFVEHLGENAKRDEQPRPEWSMGDQDHHASKSGEAHEGHADVGEHDLEAHHPRVLSGQPKLFPKVHCIRSAPSMRIEVPLR